MASWFKKTLIKVAFVAAAAALLVVASVKKAEADNPRSHETHETRGASHQRDVMPEDAVIPHDATPSAHAKHKKKKRKTHHRTHEKQTLVTPEQEVKEACGTAPLELAQFQPCLVSWYSVRSNAYHDEKTGKLVRGTVTASGLPLNDQAMTAAHKTLPFGTKVNLVNARTGKALEVTITDRGPYGRAKHRTFDVTEGVAKALGFREAGKAQLYYRVVDLGPSRSRGASKGRRYVAALRDEAAPQ